MIDMRKESDSLGVVEVPADKLWGAQTQRSLGTEIFLQMGLDNKQLAADLRETHGLCDEHGDVATASLLENWIDDEAERRTWFLFEATRVGTRE